jgi:hypothetical protein
MNKLMRACGADHLREGILRYRCRNDARAVARRGVGEREQDARETLLARIEQLVEQIRFQYFIAGQQSAEEHLAKCGAFGERASDNGSAETGNLAHACGGDR